MSRTQPVRRPGSRQARVRGRPFPLRKRRARSDGRNCGTDSVAAFGGCYSHPGNWSTAHVAEVQRHALDNPHGQRTIALMDPGPCRTWHNFPVLEGRAGTRGRHLRTWGVAAVAAALVVSYAALTGALADHARTRERLLPASHSASAQAPSRGLAVLLTSTLVGGRRAAPASGPPAALHVPAGGFRELLQYRLLALLTIALTCLIIIILVIICARRRGMIAAGSTSPHKGGRGSALGSPDAGAAHGRHAVAGPAGSGDPPTGRPDFVRRAFTRRGIRDLAIGRFGSGTRGSGDLALDGLGLRGSGPCGPVPVPRADAGDGAPGREVAPATLQARFEPWDKSSRKASSGPPWEPVENPPGQLSTAPTSPAWDRNDDAAPLPGLNRPDGGTDILPAGPPHGTQR
jgi:hypothetical protein